MYIYDSIVGNLFRILKTGRQYLTETLSTPLWIQSAKLTQQALQALKDQLFVQNSTMAANNNSSKHDLSFLLVIMKPDQCLLELSV